MTKLAVKSDSLEVRIWADGEEVTNASQLVISFSPDDIPKAHIEYPCWEGVTFDGDAEVHHYCPLRGRQK